MSQLTVTVSPKEVSDFRIIEFAKFCVEKDYKFLMVEHTETGHKNWHIYFDLPTVTRTNNFRRNFTQFIVGDSNIVVALKVTNAHSLQAFINYVFHEESCKLLLRNKMQAEEIDNCIKNRTIFQAYKNETKVLTVKNASQVIYDYCVKNKLKPYESYHETDLMKSSMLELGYTFVGLRGKLKYVMAEVNFRLTKNPIYTQCLTNELFEIEHDAIQVKHY